LQVEIYNPEPGGGYSMIIRYPIYMLPLWMEPVLISSIYGCYTCIAVDDADHVYVVYNGGSGQTNLYFISSADKGFTWGSETIIENSVNDYPADMTVDSNGNIYIVWVNGPDVYFKYSGDNGVTWSLPLNLSNSPGSTEWTPRIAVDADGNINVVYDGPFFTRSTDGGSTWSIPHRLDTDGPCSDIAISGSGNIHVVWDGPPLSRPIDWTDITYCNSSDDGLNWSSAITLQHSTTIQSVHPRIAGDQAGNVYVLWNYLSPGNWHWTFISSSNNGTNWTGKKPLSSLDSYSEFPSITVDGAGNLNVVVGLEERIYFMRSIDKGLTWSTPFRISADHQSRYPDIATDSSGRNYVVWADGGSGIYFCKTLH
jgi:hypothetical protein